MKKSPLTMVLIGVVALLSLVSFGIGFWNSTDDAALRQENEIVAVFNQRQPVINALANDAKQYSEKHPDIDPILVAAGIKPAKTPAK